MILELIAPEIAIDAWGLSTVLLHHNSDFPWILSIVIAFFFFCTNKLFCFHDQSNTLKYLL